MPDRKLKVVGQEEDFTPNPDADATGFRGEGDWNYLCGNCDAVLAEKIGEAQIRNIHLTCNKCGSINQT